MQKSHRPIVVALVALVFFVTACGFGDERQTAETRTFDGVRDVVAAIEAGGIPCDAVKVFGAVSDESFETGRCRAEGGVYEVDIYTFAEHGRVGPAVANLHALYPYEVLVGPNWYLTTGHLPLTREIAGAIGGDIVEPSLTPSSS